MIQNLKKKEKKLYCKLIMVVQKMMPKDKKSSGGSEIQRLDFKENPMSAQQAIMKDEFIRDAFQKLVASGLVKTK